ncbi:DUF2867 domain-containing protein [Bradyrhizobium sp. ARR65]|uniref:DUF2867 domain-containing protein n=1 Tax=Bradyrhizobium sp. ARR65 TaxID=1040989 RepID=UPI000465779D|nr:DUF2867 domain-containing protein [Bradyrhizobium sp. ARR65]
MKVHEITPAVDPASLLAGAQSIDAFRIVTIATSLDARQAAEKMLTFGPRWIKALLKLRNILVSPFGLKTSGAGEPASGEAIGIFPVLSETPQRLVAGFDDHHLDFRIVIDVAAAEGGQQVTATTLVLTHNLLGRTYLKLIMPFHRLIARTLLRQVAKIP